MTDYVLTADPKVVLRTADGAWVPTEPLNRDGQKYLDWLAAGNVPDPYVVPLNTSLDKRRFWTKAALDGYISQDSALDAMHGDIPQVLVDYVATLPPTARFVVRMQLLAETFDRHKTGAIRFMEAFNITESDMDMFFESAKSL
jgi:hypothetical protein